MAGGEVGLNIVNKGCGISHGEKAARIFFLTEVCKHVKTGSGACGEQNSLLEFKLVKSFLILIIV